jgi:hypothetical protein
MAGMPTTFVPHEDWADWPPAPAAVAVKDIVSGVQPSGPRTAGRPTARSQSRQVPNSSGRLPARLRSLICLGVCIGRAATGKRSFSAPYIPICRTVRHTSMGRPTSTSAGAAQSIASSDLGSSPMSTSRKNCYRPWVSRSGIAGRWKQITRQKRAPARHPPRAHCEDKPACRLSATT